MKLVWPTDTKDTDTGISAHQPLLAPLCLLVVVLVVFRLLIGRPGQLKICRLVVRVIRRVWQELAFCCCAVKLRIQEMGEQINYQEELQWGLN
ncbi:hypothetical protein BaRGS_00032245 [Batillaria attramentaria]|uniref:ATP synthase F0 subunit 8 n=1 Tax=Batillaria attramentaria TaxID=370345 RepID=A0ABD0JNG4_9CAEN